MICIFSAGKIELIIKSFNLFSIIQVIKKAWNLIANLFSIPMIID